MIQQRLGQVQVQNHILPHHQRHHQMHQITMLRHHLQVLHRGHKAPNQTAGELRGSEAMVEGAQAAEEVAVEEAMPHAMIRRNLPLNNPQINKKESQNKHGPTLPVVMIEVAEQIM